MDKGIRPYANSKFVEMLSQRSELGDTKFRKTVISLVASEFSISIGAASMHYNHAFKKIKESNPELVLGLGRTAPTVVMADPYFFPTEAPVTPVVEFVAVAEVEVEKLFTVKRAKDGVVIFTDMTKAEADELIAKAAKGKKAKLVAE